jgi:hypothetical protein
MTDPRRDQAVFWAWVFGVVCGAATGFAAAYWALIGGIA